MTHTLHSAIPILLERFNFEKVRSVMQLLNWTWTNGSVPTILDLQETAEYLLSGCVAEFDRRGQPKSGMVFATGGFQATVETFETGEPRLQLLFYVDCTSSTGEY